MLLGLTPTNRRVTAIVVTSLSLILLVSFSCCATVLAENNTEISFEAGQLTVSAHEASLELILKSISDKTGIQINSLTKLSTITLQFSNLSLEAGLKRLLKSYSYSLVYGTKPTDINNIAIRQVIILEKLKRKTGNTQIMSSHTGNNQSTSTLPEKTRSPQPINEDAYLPEETVFPTAPDDVDTQEVEQIRSMMEQQQQLEDINTEIKAVMESMEASGWQDKEAVEATVHKLRQKMGAEPDASQSSD